MRVFVFGVAVILSGCSAPPPAGPEPKLEISATASDGEKALAVRNYCARLSDRQCLGYTLRCEAYRKSFIPACMTKIGVPPGYTMVLQPQ